MLISLAPALTMGLLVFAAAGPQAAALGIPAALLASAVGGAVFALLAGWPMAAGGPGPAPSCAQVYRNIALHLSQRLRAAASAWHRSLQ